MRRKIGFILIIGALVLSSCSSLRNVWNGSGYPGREYRDNAVMDQAQNGQKKLVVYLDSQIGELYANGRKGLTFPVSTGIPGHSTPAGNFKIIAKELNNTSSIYGSIYNSRGEVVVAVADTRKDRVPPGGYYLGAKMPYTMKFTDLCAFHEGIVPEVPTLTSHGCIHLTHEIAEELYRLCPEGTPVIIYSKTPARN